MDKSYLDGDTHGEYIVAWGGRCYKEDKVFENQLAKLACPRCDKVFNDQWSYESHYDACHRKEMF